jgi:hypothetical protein
MKVKTTKISNTTKNMALRQKTDLLQFTIAESIMKDHFKLLMKLARLYDASTKTGYIVKKDEPDFNALVDIIEKSDSQKCAVSHRKCAEKKAKKSQRKSISFEEYCEEYLDTHLALMSDEEKKEARIGYSRI